MKIEDVKTFDDAIDYIENSKSFHRAWLLAMKLLKKDEVNVYGSLDICPFCSVARNRQPQFENDVEDNCPTYRINCPIIKECGDRHETTTAHKIKYLEKDKQKIIRGIA